MAKLPTRLTTVKRTEVAVIPSCASRTVSQAGEEPEHQRADEFDEQRAQRERAAAAALHRAVDEVTGHRAEGAGTADGYGETHRPITTPSHATAMPAATVSPV